MSFFIAQLLGMFSTVCAIFCVQAKTAGGILLGQFLANSFSGLSYGLLGSLSGAWVCILAAVHSVVISLLNRKEKAQRKKLILPVSIFFALAYAAGSLMTYSRWTDVISCVCALLFVLTIAQEEAGKMRNVMLLSMTLWVIFDIAVGAYTSIISHGSTIVSLLGAKLRLDRR